MSYTVKGSCSAGTGAMDGVDRWTLFTDVTPRAATSAASQAWFVFTDGNGVDHCFSYNSSSDDIFRLAHSPGGNYVAAGTANQQPTATDECFDSASGTWTGSTASGDRVWHLWATSDKKMWRSACYRAGVLMSINGIEKLQSDLIAPGTWSLAVGGGTAAVYKFYANSTGTTYSLTVGINASYSASVAAQLARVHTSADFTITCGGCLEQVYNGRPDVAAYSTETPELQGSKGNLIIPHAIATQTTNAQGKVGRKYDWWFAMGSSSSLPAVGSVFGGNAFFAVDVLILWVWDGSTFPQTG